MKWVLIIVAALVSIVAILFVVGSLRPADHVASITVRLAKPDSVVWAVVSDFPRVPEWFGGVKSVERIADIDGQPAYKENYDGFEVTQVVREWIERRKIKREILPSGSFSGTWTLELMPDGDGTTLTITEHGHVGNPLFRAMMMFADNQKTMRQYVAALAERLGTAVAAPATN